MPTGIPIGRLFGTDIHASVSFFVLLGFLLLRAESSTVWVVAVWEVALIVSVLTHEFGHAFAVRRALGSESRILLWAFGGLCFHEPTRVVRKRIFISLMGPAFGFALGLPCVLIWWLAAPEHEVGHYFLKSMIYINIAYTGLNLLPMLPLDGGQAALAALESRLPADRALAVVRRTSVAVAAGGIATALYLHEPLFAVAAAILLYMNLARTGRGV